ncbi:MAG: DNA polymerase III subunit delta [Vicinamibacterales bacterium]
MPGATTVAVRKQIAQGTPDPIYLILGDDEAAMSRLATDLGELVEDELRAFNLERLYASDKAVSASSIVESARTLPMMGDRRVVVVLRAERILKPKRRARPLEGDEPGEVEEEPAGDLDALGDYAARPEPRTTLVLVAADIDRGRKGNKALLKYATVVECWGLRGGKEDRVDLRQAARSAELLVRQAVMDACQQIDAPAVRLLTERAGTDISRLRGDVERLLLYASGKPKISLQDVREVVSSESSQDDWGVTNAITRGDTAEALRQLGLAIEAGGVSYQIVGQLAWFVRERLAAADPRRIRTAVDALFRTDLELKSSGGDPRVLLERLVIDLCRR